MPPKLAEPRLLLVHQGYELYGSDRVFLQSLKAVRQRWPNAHITVHLPQEGELCQHVKGHASIVVYSDLWVLRRSRLKWRSWQRLFKIPKTLFKAYRLSCQHDMVYISTSVIISYNLAVRFSKTPHILHAHEYKSGLEQAVLQTLSNFAKPLLIANSNATRNAFNCIKNTQVILNAIAHSKRDFVVKPLHGQLNLLLMGRINRWKGHFLALQALQILMQDTVQVHLRFVGGVFENQNIIKRELQYYIKKKKLEDHVTFHDFTSETDEHYEWAHAVLVPSTEPEPFGLVAIEAMARKRPVIAACHGGLLDSVINEETGLFFKPGDAHDLSRAIRTYQTQPGKLTQHGEAGYQRFIDHFQEDRYNQAIVHCFEAHLND